jgi:protein-S-isoprenylcysteine O-methyltransferase Ste14
MPSDARNERDGVPAVGIGTLLRATPGFGVYLLILAALMFLPAGIGWRKGWLFLSVLLALTLVSVTYSWRSHPEPFVVRCKIRAGTKSCDIVILVLLLVSAMAIFPIAGFDARYHLSFVPPWLIAIGYGIFATGFTTFNWIPGVNRFAEPTVRIQSDQGHTVIDTGPYAIVRHPLYLSGTVLLSGVPLALGSFWALIPAAVATLVIVVRTALEDRTLHQELEGYSEYAARVRYRLIPGVW